MKNNKLKSIESIIPPPPAQMVGDGFRVHHFFPAGSIGKRRMSPFYLLDYNAKMEFIPSERPRGVGVHPHRGFETVTIAYHGRIAHHDSAGNSGVIGEGDVQWMTAASGLLHKEYHEDSFSRQGGLFQMVQLWVNLPAKYKMMPPKYQEIPHSTFSTFILPANNGVIEVIAGEYEFPGAPGSSIKGPASTFTPLHVFNTKLKTGAAAEFSFPATYNTALLVVEGSITINQQDVPTDHFVLFKNDGDWFEISASSDAIVLILSGEPIDEPIVQYGPFLMNTWEELEQAYKDVNAGKLGVLEE